MYGAPAGKGYHHVPISPLKMYATESEKMIALHTTPHIYVYPQYINTHTHSQTLPSTPTQLTPSTSTTTPTNKQYINPHLHHHWHSHRPSPNTTTQTANNYTTPTLRSPVDVGLSSGSFLRQTEMKSMKSVDQFSGRCNFGGSFCAMW